MTDRPRRSIAVGRLRIRLFVKRGIGKASTEPLPKAFAPLLVSAPETTAFDLVRYAPRIGGIGRSAETLVPLVPLLRPAQLRHVLDAEDEPATAQRLGYILETVGQAKLAQTVRAWLPARLPVVRLATSAARQSDAALNARWRVLNNAGESALHLPWATAGTQRIHRDLNTAALVSRPV